MSNNNQNPVSHEFRTSRENIKTFKNPIAVFRAPFNGLIKVRWFQSSAGGVLASQQIGAGVERFAFVTRSEPFSLEWKPLAQYPDYRMFSTERDHMPLWSDQWFDELKPYHDLFRYGPKGGVA